MSLRLKSVTAFRLFTDLGAGRMSLFTVIWDFRGGTYISQVRAPSAHRAFLKWAETLDVTEIAGVGPAGKQRIIREIEEFDHQPTPLAGLKNAWCAGSVAVGGLVNIVQTEAR